MPRTGRGGARQGTPGQAYGNRTDLNASMPIQTATGQGYGEAAQQQAAQRAIPVAAQPVQGASAPVAQSPAPSPAPAPQTVSEQLPQQAVYPGELKFDHPTEFPNEPITSGIAMGEGAGPEALVGSRPNVSNLLGNLASARGASATMLDLASAARTLGL